MAHYAFLDENNVVTEVITGVDETELIDGLTPEEWYGNFRGQRCIRTSYNNSIRKVYAEVGGTYSDELDVFIPKKLCESWVFDEERHQWFPPVAYPTDGKYYLWNEETLSWIENKK